MFGTKKKLEILQTEFEQYKYDQSNLPKYYVGQKLSDGTVITKVMRSTDVGVTKGFNFNCESRVKTYYWIYEGIRDGKLTNSFTHNKINAEAFIQLKTQLKDQSKLIKNLQWQINNPPKYKIGQNVKGYGECVNIEVISNYRFGFSISYSSLFSYKYTFKNKNKTITVCE